MIKNKVVSLPSQKIFLTKYFEDQCDERIHILFQCLASATIVALLGLGQEHISDDKFIISRTNHSTNNTSIEEAHINDKNLWWQLPLAWVPAYGIYYGLNTRGVCVDTCIAGGTYRRFSEYFPLVMCVKTSSQLLQESIDSAYWGVPYAALNLSILPVLFHSIIPNNIRPTAPQSLWAPYTNIMKTPIGKLSSLLATLCITRACLELVYDKDPSHWSAINMFLAPILSTGFMLIMSHIINPTEPLLQDETPHHRAPIASHNEVEAKTIFDKFKHDVNTNETPYSAIMIVHILSVIADLATLLADSKYPWTIYISTMSLFSIFLKCFIPCCPETALSRKYNEINEKKTTPINEVIVSEPKPETQAVRSIINLSTV